MSASIEIQIIAVLVAVACALPGVFLVLRQLAMMSDAISHAILPGIVIAFLLTEDLSSPLLILGAAAAGVATVALVELLRKTGLLKEDAAIGIVFPALFSVGVILIARFAGDVHLDVDAVLLGELAFAPFDRVVLGSIDVPKATLVMASILMLNVVFIGLFFKELKLATFDSALAATLGFTPVLLHYVLMGLVSTTAVGAFDAVGSILVVALMVAPPAAAYMLTQRLASMLWMSAALGAISAVGGYWMARWLDASIAGSMAYGWPRFSACSGLCSRARSRITGATAESSAAGFRARHATHSSLSPRRAARSRAGVPRGTSAGSPAMGAGFRYDGRSNGKARWLCGRPGGIDEAVRQRTRAGETRIGPYLIPAIFVVLLPTNSGILIVFRGG